MAAVSMYHGMDTWSIGAWLSESLTGNVQHRKIKMHRLIASAGKLLEASVKKMFIVDRAELDIESVLKHDNSLLIRKAIEKPLTEDECWQLLGQLDTAVHADKPRKGKDKHYLGIPEKFYPVRPVPKNTNLS